eukprot:TRINITY_DN4261_c0_g1_i1.p3 TRINITY_DN4261_c0_g1~~TRINITY_DN4261_c0_g1_i1.p3  ORF type:complete len:111 (+),score=6.50 TRINITY_DN4261_c0_g1_i1:399-731(+)
MRLKNQLLLKRLHISAVNFSIGHDSGHKHLSMQPREQQQALLCLGHAQQHGHSTLVSRADWQHTHHVHQTLKARKEIKWQKEAREVQQKNRHQHGPQIKRAQGVKQTTQL